MQSGTTQLDDCCTAADASRLDPGAALIPVGEAREFTLEDLTPADRLALIAAATAAQEALA